MTVNPDYAGCGPGQVERVAGEEPPTPLRRATILPDPGPPFKQLRPAKPAFRLPPGPLPAPLLRDYR